MSPTYLPSLLVPIFCLVLPFLTIIWFLNYVDIEKIN